MVHHVAWHAVAVAGHRDGRAAVVVVGGDTETREFVHPRSAGAGVPYAVCADPAEIAATDEELGRDAVVLVLPAADDSPEESVDVVMRTLRHLLDRGAKARLWVLTERVHEGATSCTRRCGVWPEWLPPSIPRSSEACWTSPTDGLPVGALASLHGHRVVVMRDGVAQIARLAPRGAAGPAHR